MLMPALRFAWSSGLGPRTASSFAYCRGTLKTGARANAPELTLPTLKKIAVCPTFASLCRPALALQSIHPASFYARPAIAGRAPKRLVKAPNSLKNALRRICARSALKIWPLGTALRIPTRKNRHAASTWPPAPLCFAGCLACMPPGSAQRQWLPHRHSATGSLATLQALRSLR